MSCRRSLRGHARNIRSGVRYIPAWLNGRGAAPLAGKLQSVLKPRRASPKPGLSTFQAFPGEAKRQLVTLDLERADILIIANRALSLDILKHTVENTMRITGMAMLIVLAAFARSSFGARTRFKLSFASGANLPSPAYFRLASKTFGKATSTARSRIFFGPWHGNNAKAPARALQLSCAVRKNCSAGPCKLSVPIRLTHALWSSWTVAT